LFSKVYTAVLLNANESCFNKFIDLHNNCDLQEEKIRIAQALGAVKDEKLIRKVLEFSLSVRNKSLMLIFFQDFFIMFTILNEKSRQFDRKIQYQLFVQSRQMWPQSVQLN